MSIRTRIAAVENRLSADGGNLGYYPHLSPAELDAEAARLRAEGRSILVAPNALPGFPQIIELVDGGLLTRH